METYQQLWPSSFPTPQHVTHNRGIRGEQAALTSLSENALMRGMGSTWISLYGLLCGARVVTASYIAMYNAIRETDNIMRAWPDWLIEEDLMNRSMSLFFTNYLRDQVPGPQAVD